jgi:aldehyde:ferredoxin oxidoreductase
MDTILRIDVGADGGPKAVPTPLGDYTGLGGRGLTSAIIAGEVPADAHPLGPENKLVIAPGLLSGTAASMSVRVR